MKWTDGPLCSFRRAPRLVLSQSRERAAEQGGERGGREVPGGTGAAARAGGERQEAPRGGIVVTRNQPDKLPCCRIDRTPIDKRVGSGYVAAIMTAVASLPFIFRWAVGVLDTTKLHVAVLTRGVALLI